MARTHDTPSEVEAAEGSVTVDGPGGIVVSLTPDAAAKTSERLLDASRAAIEQGRPTSAEADDGERPDVPR
jgi:hypothetical protein